MRCLWNYCICLKEQRHQNLYYGFLINQFFLHFWQSDFRRICLRGLFVTVWKNYSKSVRILFEIWWDIRITLGPFLVSTRLLWYLQRLIITCSATANKKRKQSFVYLYYHHKKATIRCQMFSHAATLISGWRETDL